MGAYFLKKQARSPILEGFGRNIYALLSFSGQQYFKNLCGKNFSGNDYQNYLRTVCQDIGVTTGAIEYYADNVLIEKATIPEF